MRRLILCVLTGLAMAACGGPPNQEMTEAEVALKDAEFARKCAPDEYAAAETAYAKAQKLMDEEKYSEAKEQAEAAKKLAIHARNKALLNKEACEAAENEAEDAAAAEEEARRKAEEEARRAAEAAAAAAAMPTDSFSLETVYFDFNVSEISEAAKSVLNQNASWLESHQDVRVIIGGHCDERGSTEYNMALGERRAQMVRKYLISMGVDANQLQVRSYGEEALIDYGHTEAAHARNRRADFEKR